MDSSLCALQLSTQRMLVLPEGNGVKIRVSLNDLLNKDESIHALVLGQYYNRGTLSLTFQLGKILSSYLIS